MKLEGASMGGEVGLSFLVFADRSPIFFGDDGILCLGGQMKTIDGDVNLLFYFLRDTVTNLICFFIGSDLLIVQQAHRSKKKAEHLIELMDLSTTLNDFRFLSIL